MKKKLTWTAKFLIRIVVYPIFMLMWPVILMFTLVGWATDEEDPLYTPKEMLLAPYSFLIKGSIVSCKDHWRNV